MIHLLPKSTLFPYTTLFRSGSRRPPGPDRRVALLRRPEHGGDGRGGGSLDGHRETRIDRKSTRLNSSHQIISYAVFCLKKKKKLASKMSVKRQHGKCKCEER